MKTFKKFFIVTLAIFLTVGIIPPINTSAAVSSDYGYIWPVDGQIFGRGFTSSHDALDIVAPTGTSVKAAKAGNVYCASTATTSASGYCSTCRFYGAGYHVTLTHSDGRVTMYCHLNSVSVSKGANVSSGQQVGTVGATGNASGAHLHFSMYGGVPMNDSNVLDPLVFLSPFSSIQAYDITETSATIKGTFGAYGPTIVSAGFYIGTSTSNMTKITETLNTNGYYNGVPIYDIYYNTAKWYGTLNKSTTYYYRLWIYRDGKEYVSAVSSFTTGGPHTHSWSSWTVTTQPTCTKNGVQTRTCACGEKQTQSIAATGHTWKSWTTQVAATCTGNGTQIRYCACGESQTRSIQSLGHSYTTIAATNATCTTPGKTESTICSRCGNIGKASTAIPKLNHSWGSWKTTKEATTSSIGIAERRCSICKETETKTLPKLIAQTHTHTYGEWKTEKAATCASEGYKTRKCSSCSAKEAQTIAAKGHDYQDWTVKIAATVEAEGKLISVCKNCDNEQTKTIPKLPPVIEVPKDTTAPETSISGTPDTEADTTIENTGETDSPDSNKQPDTSLETSDKSNKGNDTKEKDPETDNESDKDDFNKSDFMISIAIGTAYAVASISALIIFAVKRKKR